VARKIIKKSQTSPFLRGPLRGARANNPLRTMATTKAATTSRINMCFFSRHFFSYSNLNSLLLAENDDRTEQRRVNSSNLKAYHNLISILLAF
jgi:hypothetical protein